MKKSFLKIVPITFGVGFGIMLVSCGGSKEDPTLTDVEVTTDTLSSETRVNFDLIRVKIPSAGNLVKQLADLKVPYNKSFLLPSGKTGSYSTNYQKAIGMGALGADIGFTSAYSQQQDAIEYLNQINKLAGDLGISSAFDTGFAKQLLENIGKPDTFQLMLDKAFEKAERNLRSNQRVATTVLMVSGGWVEGIYTIVEGLSSVPKDSDTKQIYKDLSAQCYALNYVFELLDAYKSNADCAKLLQEMEPHKATLLSYGKTGWGPESIAKLKETISAIRNKITS